MTFSSVPSKTLGSQFPTLLIQFTPYIFQTEFVFYIDFFHSYDI